MSGQILLFDGDSEQSEKPAKRRYVYVIQDGHGSIKIGIANDVQGRLRQHQTSASGVLRLIGFRAGTLDDERRLHALCQQDRLSGEWFKPTHRVKAVTAIFLCASEWFHVLLALKCGLKTSLKYKTDQFTREELEIIYERRREDRLSELVGRVFCEPVSRGAVSGVATALFDPVGCFENSENLPAEDVAVMQTLPPFAGESDFIHHDGFGRITVERESAETIH